MERPVILVVSRNPGEAREIVGALAERGVEARNVHGVSEAIEIVAPILSDYHSRRFEASEASGFSGLVGRSEGMERVRERVARLSASDDPVLLVGEPGTGKELAARLLHQRSSRHAAPFVVADARVSAPGAFEEELFRKNGGLVDLAADGTLFVEEILDLPAATLDRLLRDYAAGRLQTRIVGATSRDPRRAADEGRVSRDVVSWFGTSVVHLPPLRERLEDVPLIAQGFLDALRAINDLTAMRFDPEAAEALSRWRWPGNVRELRRVVEHAALLAPDGWIRPEHLPEAVRQTGGGDPGPGDVVADRPFRDAKRRVVEAFERAYLADLMRRHGGNVTAAAAYSGMLRSALQRLLRKYALKSVEFREGERGVGQEV
ncbi:MAG TPA: sigma 54-interacting transcriptional regulator [Candidatus Polarisedimenticolaceae bacterium]